MEVQSSTNSTNLVWHHTNPSNCWLAITVDKSNSSVMNKISNFVTEYLHKKENIASYKPQPFKNLHITIGFALHSATPQENRELAIKRVTENIVSSGFTATNQVISSQNLQLTRASGAILLYLENEVFTKIQEVIRKTLTELLKNNVLSYSDIFDFSHKPHVTLGNLQFSESWKGLVERALPDQRKFSDESQIREFNHAFYDFRTKQLKYCSLTFPLRRIDLLDVDGRSPVATIKLPNCNPLGPISYSKIEHDRSCAKQNEEIPTQQNSCEKCHHTVKVVTLFENKENLVKTEKEFKRAIDQKKLIEEMKTERKSMTVEKQSLLTVKSLFDSVVNFDPERLTSTINKRLIQT